MLGRQADRQQASKQATTSELDDDTGRAAEGDREEEHKTTVGGPWEFSRIPGRRRPFSKITADSTAQEQEQEEQKQKQEQKHQQ